jgi:hypothetical protein
MRDRRFVAVHRGGPLSLEHHRLLMAWAHDCAEHVLVFGANGGIDEQLRAVLAVAKAWEHGECSVGDARKASLTAIGLARVASVPSAIAVARACGHAVATAHMADHSLRAAEYALKAVKYAGQAVEIERNWQEQQLAAAIFELVRSAQAQQGG